MRIVWDEPKRFANLDKHGLDFADLTIGFFAGAVVAPARPPRWRAVGALGVNLIVVVFAPLGAEAVAVVSMRSASRRERELLKWP